MKLDFSRQIFEKCSNIKFQSNKSCGSRVILCGLTDTHEWTGRQTDRQTDIHDVANSHFSQLAKALKKWTIQDVVY
jgi:hypothetical protein